MENLDLFRELDPVKLRKKFLAALLNIQNVSRGSIWLIENGSYVCVEAAGDESDRVIGVRLEPDQKSIVGWVIQNKKMAIAEPESDHRHYGQLEDRFAVKSSMILCFPLYSATDQPFGAVQIIDTSVAKSRLNLDKAYLATLQNLVDVCSIALGNAILFSREKEKNRHLERALSRAEKKEDIVGISPNFTQSMALVKSYAGTDFHVLITGESGTGKELAAQQIHQLSSRKDKPFLAQNCSAIPETLLESELFGYKKGAFTGALKDKTGLFEAAAGGTVFLDEIGDMPLGTQAGLLRVLQKNEIKPLGENRARHVDIRIVAATNKDIKQMIADNTFRQDLFYRLSVLPVHLPPLRERREDIPLLARFFLETESARAGIPEKSISPLAMRHLMTYDWPGNIRELENLIRYLIVVTPTPVIESVTLPGGSPGAAAHPGETGWDAAGTDPSGERPVALTAMSWLDLEKTYVKALLKKHNWNVTWAARTSGINRSTFASRMRKLNIRRDDFSE